MQSKRRPLGWDLILTLFTAFTLMAFGILCLFGMFYYKWQSTGPAWSVLTYQQMMNRLAAPLVILLIVWLVLCIPKRIFPRRALIGYSAGVLGLATVVFFLTGLRGALSLILVLSSALQAVILVPVVDGARLRFTRRGLAVRIGSCLLHLGFVLFILDLVALRGSSWHLPLYWVSITLLTGGCLLTFYFPRLK